MAFIKKIWKDRISQFPNRRTINDGYVTKQVTVGRDEGTITEQGDAFDATNMNDLEQRIEDAYGDVTALVASEVAQQYDSQNVIFDPVATEGHGVGFVVSSEYIANLEVGDLADTEISGQAQGEALVWDGAKWVNGTVSTVGNLDDLSDVDTDGKATGDSLRYDGAEWVAKPTTVEMTQAEWNAIVDKAAWRNAHKNTYLVITDAPNLNATASDIEYSSGVTVYDKINGLATVATSGSYDDLSNKPIHFRGTLGLDVMQVMKDLPNNSICCYTDSNNPTNQPTGHAWGSYFMYKTNGGARAYYTDNDCFAVSSRVTSTSNSITWKIFT